MDEAEHDVLAYMTSPRSIEPTAFDESAGAAE